LKKGKKITGGIKIAPCPHNFSEIALGVGLQSVPKYFHTNPYIFSAKGYSIKKWGGGFVVVSP